LAVRIDPQSTPEINAASDSAAPFLFQENQACSRLPRQEGPRRCQSDNASTNHAEVVKQRTAPLTPPNRSLSPARSSGKWPNSACRFGAVGATGMPCGRPSEQHRALEAAMLGKELDEVLGRESGSGCADGGSTGRSMRCPGCACVSGSAP